MQLRSDAPQTVMQHTVIADSAAIIGKSLHREPCRLTITPLDCVSAPPHRWTVAMSLLAKRPGQPLIITCRKPVELLKTDMNFMFLSHFETYNPRRNGLPPCPFYLSEDESSRECGAFPVGQADRD